MSKFDIKGFWLGLASPEKAWQGWEMELPADDTEALVYSIQKYMNEEFDQDVSAMKAKFLLEYMWEEIAPFAYNAGVKDAEDYMRAKVEELPNICFRDGLTYWRKR